MFPPISAFKSFAEHVLISLVELIVVLVILAILAAIMVPALIGWIDKAKEKQLIVTGRTVMLAGQSAADEAYGLNKDLDEDLIKQFLKDEDLQAGSKWAIKFEKYKVTAVDYSDGTDYIYYNGKEWEKKEEPTLTGGSVTKGTGTIGGNGPSAAPAG